MISQQLKTDHLEQRLSSTMLETHTFDILSCQTGLVCMLISNMSILNSIQCFVN